MATDDDQQREYLRDLRARLSELDQNLLELEARTSTSPQDRDAYVQYQAQFERIRNSRKLFHVSLREAEDEIGSTARDAAEWAELSTRMEIAWRDILDEVASVDEPSDAAVKSGSKS